MFFFSQLNAIKSKLIFACIVLSALSLNAEAALTSITTSNGIELVYSSVSNVTWTKDGNLLRTLMASSSDNDGNGTLDIIDAIIAESPLIINTPSIYSPDGIFRMSSSEFSNDGRTSWFGALAFVNYLNSINYAGSNRWYLPTVDNTNRGFNTSTNGIFMGDELVELYYQELGSKSQYVYVSGNAIFQPDHGIVDRNNVFINEQSDSYWATTEYVPFPQRSYTFGTSDGYSNIGDKGARIFAWAVSPGQITPVPEPDSMAILLLGLGFIGVAVRRSRN